MVCQIVSLTTESGPIRPIAIWVRKRQLEAFYWLWRGNILRRVSPLRREPLFNSIGQLGVKSQKRLRESRPLRKVFSAMLVPIKRNGCYSSSYSHSHCICFLFALVFVFRAACSTFCQGGGQRERVSRTTFFDSLWLCVTVSRHKFWKLETL